VIPERQDYLTNPSWSYNILLALSMLRTICPN